MVAQVPVMAVIGAVKIGQIVYKVARSPQAQQWAKQAIRKGASIVKKFTGKTKGNLTSTIVKNMGKVKDKAPKGTGKPNKVKEIIKNRQLTKKQREIIANKTKQNTSGKPKASETKLPSTTVLSKLPKAARGKNRSLLNRTKRSERPMKDITPKSVVSAPRLLNAPKGKSLTRAQKLLIGGGLTAAGVTAAALSKDKKSKIPRKPESTGVAKDQPPVRRTDWTPSLGRGDFKAKTKSNRFRDADRGSMKKLSDVKSNRFRDADRNSTSVVPRRGGAGRFPNKSTTTSTPTKADKSSANKGPSGSSFGSFKEAFKHHQSLKNKPTTFTYKGKSYANVTKDQLAKSGHKTLRSYLNAKGKPKSNSSSNSDAGKQNKLVGGKGWGLTKEAQAKLPKWMQKIGVGKTKGSVTLFGKKFNLESKDPRKPKK